jgi:hypothetical protein
MDVRTSGDVSYVLCMVCWCWEVVKEVFGDEFSWLNVPPPPSCCVRRYLRLSVSTYDRWPTPSSPGMGKNTWSRSNFFSPYRLQYGHNEKCRLSFCINFSPSLQKVYSKKSMFRTVPVSVKMVKSTAASLATATPAGYLGPFLFCRVHY